MKAKILKKMVANGQNLVSGDIVDIKGWLNINKLASNRYIQLIEEEEKPPKVEALKVETPKAKAPKAKPTKK